MASTLTNSDLIDLISGDPDTQEEAINAPPQVELCDDGYLVNLETGEVVGHVGQEEGFRPCTTEGVEWVLERLAEQEAQLNARKQLTAAKLEAMKALERIHERRLAYLKYRFQGDIADFCRKAIEGKKTKTVLFENGKVSFRSTAGTNDIIDMDKAIAFVDAHEPTLVKREVTVSSVLKVVKALGKAGEEPNLKEFLASTGPKESVSINTGIGK